MPRFDCQWIISIARNASLTAEGQAGFRPHSRRPRVTTRCQNCPRNGPLARLSCSRAVVWRSHEGGFWVAIPSQAGSSQVAMYTICTPSVHDPYTICTPYQQACRWLAPGLVLALSGLVRHFCVLRSALCLHSAVALGGFARPFDAGSWMLDVGCSVFSISIPNTTHLTRLGRAGLGASWSNHGHTLVP